MPLPKLMADGSGEMSALEHICPECGGQGRIAARREGNRVTQGGRCNKCGGSGGQLTQDGRRLLGFLRRHAMR